MKRPVLWLALPVIVMCIAGATGDAGFIFVFFALIVCVVLFVLLNKNKKFFIPWMIFLIISFFCIISNLSIPKTVKYINDSNESVECELSGRVVKFTKKEEYMSVHLKNTSLHNKQCKEDIRGVLVYCDPCDIKLGDKILLHGKLKPLEKPRMEGCFDEKSYYESINIFSKFNADSIQVISHDANPVTVTANSVKEYLNRSYQKISPDYAGRLSAITLGDQSLLEEDIKESYKKNGIGHLLAISGLHVSLTGMFFYKLLRKAGLSFVPCVLCGTVIILIYTVLTGGSISSIRAGVMFCMTVMADIPGRSYDPLSSLSLQCMVTLLMNPYSIRGPSFLMSYLSVLSIIILGTQFNKIRIVYKKSAFSKIVFADLMVSFSVFLGLLPVNLLFYNETPLYSVPINLMIIPLSPLLMGAALVAGSVGGILPQAGVFLIAISERIFDFYDHLCDLFSGIFKGFYLTGTPKLLSVILYYCLIVLFCIILKYKIADRLCYAHKAGLLIDRSGRKKIRDKIKIPAMISCVIVPAGIILVAAKPDEGFYCTMLDVGQGDCIFIHTESGRNLLFDGGSSNIKNVYSKRVEPFLLSKGIRNLDGVFISHSDDDHINAVQDMIDKGNIRISNIILPDINDDLKDEDYKDVLYKSEEKGIKVSYASEGFNVSERDYSLKCIFPGKEDSFTDINSLSAVYRFEYEGLSVLLTGDTTEESEKKMLEDGKIKQATILKAAHHGSNNSSHDEFLEAVSPEIALISCGVNNRYNHPGSKTTERLKDHEIPYIVTSKAGAVTIRSSGKGFRVKGFLNTRFEE